VKVTVLLFPPGVVTLTVRIVYAAPFVIANVALTEVSFTTVRPLTVIPPPDTVIAEVAVRFVPVKITGTLVLCAPEVGAIVVSAGAGGFWIVNVTLLVVPFGVTTATFLPLRLAPAAIAKVAVTVVSLTTVTPLTVTPVPDTVTDVAPVSSTPVRVTGTLAPRFPVIGATDARDGPPTVNVTVLVVPIGVTTATFLPLRVAFAAIAKVAVTVVSLTAVTPLTVTPVPDTVTDVAPVRPTPVSVTGTLFPRRPVVGLIDARVGPVTVKVTVLLVPPGAVMLTFLAVSAAPVVITKFAVTVVSFTTFKLLTLTPAPDTAIAVAPVRFVPMRVTGTVIPRWPELGAIDAKVGTGGVTTVNVTVLVVPPGAVTLTFLAVSAAFAAITNDAVTVVALTAVTPVTDIPAPETFTAVAPVRLVPVRVTGTVSPRPPVVGEIELNVGAGAENSMAPMSTAPFDFLGVPSRSTGGASP
jgi:hypothetical protein